MLCRFNMGSVGQQLSNGQLFPIRFWSAPHFAEPRTPSGKGYARGYLWRMKCAREIVAQRITSIHRIDGAFRKVENTRVAVGLLLRNAANLSMTLVVASLGSICANLVVRYNQL
jgi:hypothetical protein